MVNVEVTFKIQDPKYIEEKAQEIIKSLTITAYNRIKEKTPVDTGRARGSWFFEINPLEGYIYNTVDYIVFLENGHSQQAPNGFVAITLEEMSHIKLENI